ncbi:hypothetical protein Salat_1279500 [Sesamum alatum]|uniref:Uncharacterized protein n=1 Tax=Sesamum alatum TaxID=300844 RepID=A0AAE1YGS9_9LAMI|nr:hypothetical protein Salat_1279500 [Sesamum alatum]
MDYHQPHGYMRPPPPPPPSAADPYQRPPPPPVPPPSSNHPWPYSATQFQYQPQTQHSPSPPPPHWPPHSSDHAQYPPPPPPPTYPGHQPPPYHAHPHYPPPHPLPPRPPHVPQSYSQDWGTGNWSHQHSWDQTNNNEEDWAAKARAWAAAKAATDNQHAPSHFPPAGRPEEQNHFRDQYSQSIDTQFHEVHAPLTPAPNYQQYPAAMVPPNRTGLSQSQDSQYISSGQSSYGTDLHVPFAARDGGVARDSIAPFPQQEKSSISPLVHQQEVPSSYSSVAGAEDAGDRYEKFNSSSSLPVASLPQHHVQPLPPAGGRSGWMEEPHHLFGSQPAESVTDLSDQPLKFAPHFNRDLDPHAPSNYTHSSGGPIRGADPTVAMSSNYAWGPTSASGAVFPPVPPTIPSGPQLDHPGAMPAPASGNSAPMFPTGPGFQPTVPMVGAAFGVGPGVTPHPTAFSGDPYGVSERPKKASVPNWLREEIIKSKAVITNSAVEIRKEESQSVEEDSNEKSSRKGDQADSKSIDSSRSTEDDDEDEDEVEAARTAAINQEIKRVLTEVLLKVTDELFDEIATKVLKEDDLSVEVGRDNDMSNHQILPSTPSVLTPKASAKVLIPTKKKENDYEDTSEKSTSGAPGDILGLASYASDEEDEEIQSAGKTEFKGKLHTSAIILNQAFGRKSPFSATPDRGVANMELNGNRAAKELALDGDQHSSKKLSGTAEDELQHGSDKSNNSIIEKRVERNERRDGNLDARRLTNDDSRIQNTGNRSDKNDRHENKRSSLRKDPKDSESSKERLDKKGDEEHRRREERRARAERNDNPKDKGKEKSRTDEKVKNTESRKRLSPSGGREGRSETRRDKRTSGNEDDDEKRQDRTGDEKKERSRHKSGSESSRRKRHRSSSVGVRGRESKDNSLASHANDSSDESSDDSPRSDL